MVDRGAGMAEDKFELELKAGFRTAMREGFVHTANAFAEMLEYERATAPVGATQHIAGSSCETRRDQALSRPIASKSSGE